MFSGQFNDVYTVSAPDAPTWSAALNAGDVVLQRLCTEQAQNVFAKALFYISTAHIWHLLSHPQLGPAVLNFFREYALFYERSPNSFQAQYRPLSL